MTTLYAKNYRCTRCPEPKRWAVTFVGLNDPDGTQYPMCREHADEWKLDVMLALYDMVPIKPKSRLPRNPMPTPSKGAIRRDSGG